MLLLIAGCGENTTPTPLPPLQPTPTTPVEPLPIETVVSNGNNQLVIWLPAFTGLASEGSAGAILNNVFHQFEQRNPSIRLDVQVKADVGTASLFNFLRSAQQAAPTILPDLVLINTQQLWQIVDLGMVTPLTEDELQFDAEFYAVANASVLYHAQTMGIPYTVDIVHLAYDGDEVGLPPNNWSQLLESQRPLLFPGAENATPNATLLQYVGAGGELLEDGTIRDPAVLEDFFTFVAEAHEQNVFPASVLDLPGFNSVWRAYTEDRSALAAVQVMQFYPNATGIKPPSYALLPTRDGDSVTIADTWAFAILTQDAERRALALALIDELLAPEIQGPWSQLVARLPSQAEALALWTQANDYRDFADLLVENAIAPPNGPAFADFARRLQTAQAGVIREELSVEEAMQSMIVVE